MSIFSTITFTYYIIMLSYTATTTTAFTIPSTQTKLSTTTKNTKNTKTTTTLQMDPNIIDTDTASTLMSTMYTATAGAAKHADTSWSFLWFHGGTPDIYNNGQSLPPIPINTATPSTTGFAGTGIGGTAAGTATDVDIRSIQDYFLPTSSEEVTKRALEQAVQVKEYTKGNVINGADMIQYDAGMPGSKAYTNYMQQLQSGALNKQQQQYTYNPEINKREVEFIAREFDLFLTKIPLVVTVYALIDFFILSSAPSDFSMTNNDLEEDRYALVKEWTMGAGVRLGILSVTILGLSLIENLFYHPV